MGTSLIPQDPVRAKLPQTYEAARQALSQCSQIDECHKWANKAEALASYAKQAEDNTLHQLADRIRARAVRRMGELLQLFKSPGGRPPKTPHGAVGSFPSSQKEAARQAGISRRQKETAVRVANVPEEIFEKVVESENPPSITKIASFGTAPRKGFKQATHLIGTVADFAEFCEKNAPEDVSSGVMESEVEELRAKVHQIDAWLDRFIGNLGE